MKKKYIVPGWSTPVNMFGKTLINLSPDGGEGGGGEPVQFTPEQSAEVERRINEALESKTPDLAGSLSFIKKAGGRAYLSDQDFENDVHTNLNSILSEKIENPNELQKSLLKFKSGLIGEVLSPVDQTIKELTGVEKSETEKTRDYAKRALQKLKESSGGQVDEATVAALQAKIQEANTNSESWKTKYDSLLQTQNQTAIEQEVAKGIPTSALDYSDAEMSVVLPGIQAQVNAAFKFEVDKDGNRFAINTKTGLPELDGEGNKKPISEVVGNFVASMNGLKLKKQNSGGAGLPGDAGNGGSLTQEQLTEREAQWKKQLADKRLIGHEKESFVIRKNLGLSVPQNAINKWPELK